MIFNIQRCSIHDGTGLRTLVFFKGCGLNCPWCANPESQSFHAEISEQMNKCIGCGACKDVCPQSAIKDNYSIDRSLCIKCGACTDVCYADAKKIVGKNYSTDELFEEISKDKKFFQRQGGGVTFSGGEPFSHSDELKEIAEKCKKNRINVCIESCAFASYDQIAKVIPYVDQIFLDVKHMDSEIHTKLTGYSNEMILDNIKKIAGYGIPITIRTPIIPGMNDNVNNIEKTAEFVSSLSSAVAYELLPYHNFGESKYDMLGRIYELSDVVQPSDEQMRTLVIAANQKLKGTGKECFWMKNNIKEYS